MSKYYVVALSCIAVHAVNGMEVIKPQKDDWNPDLYERYSLMQYNAGMKALEKINFRGDEKVIDIGCNTGKLTEEIAKKVPQGSVLGIDKSSNAIQYARDKREKGNLSFEIHDIAKSKHLWEFMEEFKSTGRFDLVTAFSSLSWVEDQEQAFINSGRLLKLKGRFRAGLAHEDSAYLRARYAMLDHPKWQKYFENYKVPYYPSNEEKVKALLKRAGLKEILVAKLDVPHLFPTRQDFINFMSAIPVQIDRIPEDQHTEFFNDIIDEYLKEVSANEDGSIPITIAALAVHAENAFDFAS